jgi:hypothetical protein
VQALSFKSRWFCIAGFAGFVALCSTSIHPFGRVKRPDLQGVSARDLHVSLEAAPLLKRACMDCHSNQTVWPWYSYVAPMSWLVENDVRQGRDHVNFSAWDLYTFEQRKKLFAEIASAVKNREMPLPNYTLIHHGAKLSDADTDILYAWARLERRRLKAMLPVAARSTGQRGGGR